MKTLPLLAFICALTACFSLCEGHRRHHHGPPPAPFRPPFRRPPIYFPSGYPRYPTYLDSRRRIIIVPKFPMPPKCPNKNNTVDKNNTSEATTEAPLTNATTISVDPNSTLSQAITTISPNASNVIDNSTVPPKDTTVMPTMPTSSSPGSIPDANATASPEPKPSGSTAKPTTQGSTTVAKQNKVSQILSDLNKLWKHVMDVLQES